MKVAAIVPAAGRGRRIKSRTPKPYIKISGRPILVHTLNVLSKSKYIDEIVVAVDRNKKSFAEKEIIKKYKIGKTKVVEGGRERKDSVFNALKALGADIDYVVVHDCARPFLTDKIIKDSLDGARRFGASVVGVPVKPTLKIVTPGGRVRRTPDRRNFWEAQTPQVFRKNILEKGYRKLRRGVNITDDSMIAESAGIRPKMVMGSYDNIKITTNEDLKLAEILLKKT